MNYLLMFSLILFSGSLFAKKKEKMEQEFIPGEFIVKLKDGKNLKLDSSLTIKKSINDSFKVVTAPAEKSIQNIINSLESNPAIEYAEPNYIWRPIEEGSADFTSLDNDISSPDDPYFNTQWGLKNTGSNEPSAESSGVAGSDISALRAWTLNKGSKQIKVAVIDTGVDYNHPDLRDQMWVNERELNGTKGVDDDGNGYVDDIYGHDFSNDDGDPMDGHGHGTHCAGVIGAIHNNQTGIAGVMPNVTLVAIKFLSDSGSGGTDQAIAAIEYAIKAEVDVMSNSWGGGKYSQALEETIKRASDAGIIFVAAAGNSSENTDSDPHYPSNYEIPNVVSVGALTAQNNIAKFSNFGPETVDIAAPGKKINSTVTNNKYKVFSGTSMAAPHVAGALGLLVAHNGKMDHEDMMDRLIATAEPVPTLRGKVKSLSGSLNAYNLLSNTRPYKNIPKENEWETLSVDPFESEHPYKDKVSVKRTFHVPGAKFLRLKVRKIDLENRYEYLKISAKGVTYDKMSGKGENKTSVYVDGDTLNVEFKSDSSVNYWGFVIDEVQAVR
jgi:subtilisin family serine protease